MKATQRHDRRPGRPNIRHPRILTALPAKLKRVRPEFWINFLLACVAAYAIEQAAEWVVEEDRPGAQSVFDVSGIYQQLVTTGPRRPISHYTAVVEIDKREDPLSISHNNVCKQRSLIALLLDALAKANPAVVVLDKYFDPGECTTDPDDQRRTRELRDALGRIACRIPVIATEHAPGGEGNASHPGPPVLFDPPPCGQNLFADGPPPQPMLHLGISNLDVDTRRLPLRWLNMPPDIARRTDKGSTVALQSAKQFDLHILAKNARIQEMVQIGEDPYISFLTTDQFEHFFAGEVLCLAPGHPPMPECDELAKKAESPDGPVFGDLAHKIVVIGEREPPGEADNRHSVIGEVPGFYMWANYIEALLDDRLFRPVHPLVNYGIGFLIFALFEFVLQSKHEKPLWAVGLVLLLLFGAIVILYLTVVHTGYYLNPATVGLLAIAINLGHLCFARVKHEKAHES